MARWTVGSEKVENTHKFWKYKLKKKVYYKKKYIIGLVHEIAA